MLFSSPRLERTQPEPGPTTRSLPSVRSHHVVVWDSVTFQPPVRTPAEGQGRGQGCPVLQSCPVLPTCWPARLSVLVRRDLGAGREAAVEAAWSPSRPRRRNAIEFPLNLEIGRGNVPVSVSSPPYVAGCSLMATQLVILAARAG